MNTKRIDVSLKEEDKIEFLLRFLNGFLGLTPKELTVTAHFIRLNKNYPCGSADRKEVCKRMNLKNVQTLNNLIRSITQKKVFIRTGNGYEYASIVQNLSDLNKIQINVKDV